MAEKIISDHTFFGDYFESIQAYSLKNLIKMELIDLEILVVLYSQKYY